MAVAETKAHRAIRQYLWRKGYPGNWALASFLLDKFLGGNRVIGSDDYNGQAWEIPGVKYTPWSKKLIEDGILTRPLQVNGAIDRISYEPGRKLMKHINSEKAHREEMASMRDLHEQAALLNDKLDTKADKKDVAALADRVSRLEGAVEYLIEKYDPPVTEEKCKAALKAISPDGTTRTHSRKKKKATLW